MKKILSAFAVLMFISALAISCHSNSDKNVGKNDSIVKDSIKMDSIMKDSLKKDSLTKVVNVVK